MYLDEYVLLKSTEQYLSIVLATCLSNVKVDHLFKPFQE